jgi:hypothetical protein
VAFRLLPKSLLARLVVLLVAAATFPLFLISDRLTNGVPRQSQATGGVAVLVRQSSLASGDTVHLMVRGSPAEHGRLLQVNVVVCGGRLDWSGELYVTGTAALSGPTVIGPPDLTGNPTHLPAPFRTATGTLSLDGTYVIGSVRNAQIYDVSLSAVPPCSTSPGAVDGEGWILTGRTASSMVRAVKVLSLRGARRFISLPGTGLLPGANSRMVGVFAVPGLVGRWSLPIAATYSSTIERRPASVVEFAEPTGATLVSGLHWAAQTPEPVEAQVVDPQSEDRLRTLLSGATVLLGVGASLLAAAVWGAIRRLDQADPMPAPQPESPAPNSLALLVALAVGWLLGRKSSK